MTDKNMRRFTPQLGLVGVGVAALGALTALTGAVAAGPTGTTAATPAAPGVSQPAPTKGQLSINAKAAPLALPRAAVLSSQLAATTCDPGCDLYARTGTITPTGATAPIPIWSFTAGPTGATDPVALPGATLVATEGHSITITLHNVLPAADGNVGLSLPATSATPDQVGVASGAPGLAYTFTGLTPGTYIYEASGTAQGPRQTAMGLSGVLVVRPATFVPPPGGLTAANDLGATTDTAFNAESVIETQEIDPTFNQSPLTSDLSTFHPQYFLINGQAFGGPTPPVINVNQGDKLLLRYANLGITDREMSLVGERQRMVAQDSRSVTNVVQNDVEFLTSGQTQDTITDLGLDTKLFQDDTIALVDQGRHVYNATAGNGLGGMVALVKVNGTSRGATGPSSNVSVSPRVFDVKPGSAQLNQNQIINVSVTYSGPPATSARWYVDIDNPNNDQHGVPITGTTSTFGIELESALHNDIVQNLLLGGPPINGDHVIWVVAANGSTLGVPGGDALTLSERDPIALGIQLHRPRTNTVIGPAAIVQADGSVSAPAPNNIDASSDVVVVATGAATLNNWVVKDAQYCVDLPVSQACSGLTGSLTVNPQAPAPPTPAPCNQGAAGAYDSPTALCGTIPAASLGTLAEGAHTVSVRVQQVLASPSTGATTFTASSATDPAGTFVPDYIQGGEIVAGASHGIINTATTGAGGTTVTLQNPGWIGGTPVAGTAFTIYTNPRWGSWAAPVALQIDRHGPVVDTVANPSATPPIVAPAVAPNPNNGFQNGAGNVGFLDSVQVVATFDDTTGGKAPNTYPAGNSPVDLAEAFLGTKPADTEFGTGAEMVPNGGLWSQSPVQTAYSYVPLADVRSYASINKITSGVIPIWVHARDTAGNWGPFFEIDLNYDSVAPVAPAVTITPAANANTRTLNITGTDVATGNSGIVAAEAFIGTDPGQGNAVALPLNTNVTVSFGPAAVKAANPTAVYLGTTVPNSTTKQIQVRIKDGAGNWSTVTSVPVA